MTPTAGAATGAACTLSGHATITPGLSTASQAFSFSFTGALANCQSSATGITGGSVSATGTGSGSCGTSTGSGTALITWNTGQTSNLSFTTSGAGVLVSVSDTVTSGVFAGDTGQSELVFQADSGENCVTVPVSGATFNGPSAVGSAT